MKKILLLISIAVCLLAGNNAFAQNTVTLPGGTINNTPQHRLLNPTDSLRQWWPYFVGYGYNRVYTATELNKLFKTSSVANVYARHYTDSLAGISTTTFARKDSTFNINKNFYDVLNKPTARLNLGLGSAAIVDDALLVHRAGTETITSKKTFTDTVNIHRLRLDTNYNDTTGNMSKLYLGTLGSSGSVNVYTLNQNNCANFYQRLNNAQTVSIACYGTSIFYGLNLAGTFAPINGQSTNRSAYNAPTMLDSILKKRSGVLVDTVYNRGVPSGTSTNGWDRWRGASVTHVAFVEYGINEATGTTSTSGYKRDLTRFALRLLRDGTYVIFVLPTYTTTPAYNYYIREYSEMMREVARELSIPLYDANKQINALGSNAIQADGTHLTDAGYAAMGEGMAAFIMQSSRYPAEANRFYSALSGMAKDGTISASGAPASTGYSIAILGSTKNTFAFDLKDPVDVYSSVVRSSSTLNVLKWRTSTTTVLDSVGPSGATKTRFLFRLYPGHHVINVENLTSANTVRFDYLEFKAFSIDASLVAPTAVTNTITTARAFGINYANPGFWTGGTSFSNQAFTNYDRTTGAVGWSLTRNAATTPTRYYDMFMSSSNALTFRTGSFGDIFTIAAGSNVIGFTAAPTFPSLTASLPLKLTSGNAAIAAAISLSGSEVTNTLPTTKGGTGLAAIGTTLQLLRVNAGATALEYFTPTYGAGTVTSITPGYGHTSNTPITGSGTITIDTTTAMASKAYVNNFLSKATAATTYATKAVASADLTTQAAAGTTVLTYAVPANGVYRLEAYLTLTTAVTGGGMNVSVHYTDIYNNTHDMYFYEGPAFAFTGTGAHGFNSMCIQAKSGTSININTTSNDGVYDCGASITKLR